MTAPKRGRRTGPPPVPNELARRRGNPSKKALPREDNLVLLPGTKEPPKPPLTLGRAGKALWELAWREAHYWLAPSDVHALALLCQDIDERDELRKEALTSGDWRARIALRALDKQITDRLQLLGFTPADRTRLGVAEVRIEDDLESFRQAAK